MDITITLPADLEPQVRKSLELLTLMFKYEADLIEKHSLVVFRSNTAHKTLVFTKSNTIQIREFKEV